MPRDKLLDGRNKSRGYTCDFCNIHYKNMIPILAYTTSTNGEITVGPCCEKKARQTEAYRISATRRKEKEKSCMGRVTSYIMTTGKGWTR